jgi:hypothetical protein
MSATRPDSFGTFACDPAALHYLSQINNRIESGRDGDIDGIDVVEQFARELIADDLVARVARAA